MMHFYRCIVVSRCKVWPADSRPATCDAVRNFFQFVYHILSHLLTKVYSNQILDEIHIFLGSAVIQLYRLKAEVLGELHCLKY